MSDAALFTSILHKQYNTHNACVAIFPGSSNHERAAFQVDLPNSERWMGHAQRRTVPVPAWLDGCGTPDTVAFFRSRAQTLAYLEQQNYPAPRVVRTRSGGLVGEAHGWSTLAATFVPGQVTEPTVDQIRLMGQALAKLHNVPVATNALVGKLWWYAENIIGSARSTGRGRWTSANAMAVAAQRHAHDAGNGVPLDPPAALHHPRRCMGRQRCANRAERGRID